MDWDWELRNKLLDLWLIDFWQNYYAVPLRNKSFKQIVLEQLDIHKEMDEFRSLHQHNIKI